MDGGIDVDGGGIDIYPEPARAAITEFKSVAAAIATTFEKNLGTVAGLDSQLGKGTLGAIAYQQYQPVVDKVVPMLRDLNTGSKDYADGGLKCVDRLVEQDRVNKGNLDSVQRPNINT